MKQLFSKESLVFYIPMPIFLFHEKAYILSGTRKGYAESLIDIVNLSTFSKRKLIYCKDGKNKELIVHTKNLFYTYLSL